jgi:hypothetical protein
MGSIATAALLTGAMLSVPNLALAQASTATLAGVVVDESGGVVPGAQVTVESPQTGLQRRSLASEDGQFVFPALPPGRYRVNVELAGFVPLEVREVILNVGDEILLSLKLKVAAVGESVTVVAEPSRVNTSPAVGTVVDRQFVANLALNGRSLQSLIELTPGIVPTVTARQNQGQFSVNGQRANANYIAVDGVGANVQASVSGFVGDSANGALPGLTTFGGTNSLVSIDALEEFRVQTSSYAPEYGRTPGGQVSIVTRSGTNAFHGTLFDYFRDNALDATDWFANAAGLKKPVMRQHDFGGVLGGPAVKNRTFFFASYEGLRVRQPRVARTTVPGVSVRQLARTELQPYVNAFPVPTGPDDADTSLASFDASYSDRSNLDATSIRVDHKLSERSFLFGRYNYAPSESTQRAPTGFTANTSSRLISRTHTLTLGHTHVLSRTINNEFRLNYSHVSGGSEYTLDGFGGAVVPPDSALFPSFAPESASFFALVIGPSVVSVVPKNADNLQRQINLVNSMSVNAGTHGLKFGLDYRRLNPFIGATEYGQTIFFSSVNEFLQGRPASVLVSSFAAPREPVFTNLSLYAQDSWRMSDKLTLTYGVRWELNPPPHEVNDREPFTVRGLDDPATMTLAPLGTPFYETTYGNVAPRIGAAYLLREAQGRETVLRGGFGVFYDLGNGQIGDAYNAGGAPFVSRKALSNVAFPLSVADATPLAISTSPPITANMTTADPNLQLPYTLQWNAAVEQSFGAHQTVSATYVGAEGRRLIRPEVLLRPNAIFSNTINIIRNGSESSYNALQLQYKRRLSRGVQALVSYTWAHSTDDLSSEDPAVTPSPARRTDPAQDRGPSDFDVRHNFSAAVTYDVPAPDVRGFGNAILRGWSINGIARARSATPVDLRSRLVVMNGFRYRVRPDVVPGQPFYIHDLALPGGMALNRDAFVAPPGTRQGTLGRNVLRGFPFFQLDATLRRQFTFTSAINFQFRVDVFNVLNHPNFANPNSLLTDPNFGRATSLYGQNLGGGGIDGGFSPLFQSGGPRSIQLSLKLQF